MARCTCSDRPPNRRTANFGIAVVIAVSSPHRKAAYEANEYAIDRIKEVVPIWKKEIWEDGEEWIGAQKKYPAKGVEQA